MTDEELNKRMHEIMGLCQHNWNKAMYQNVWICSLCELTKDTASVPVNLDFTKDWLAFGLAWEFMQKHERWEEFVSNNGYSPNEVLNSDERGVPLNVYLKLINTRALAETVMEFFKGDTL